MLVGSPLDCANIAPVSLDRILRDGSLVKPTNAFAHIVPRLIRSFLTARMLAVPEPRRPVIPDQESQDEYGALAFDQDIIAALDQEDQPEYQVKDRSLFKVPSFLVVPFFSDIFISFWTKV